MLKIQVPANQAPLGAKAHKKSDTVVGILTNLNRADHPLVIAYLDCLEVVPTPETEIVWHAPEEELFDWLSSRRSAKG